MQLAEEDKGKKLGAYLQTVRYTDEAIGQFIEDLKTAGLYDNTVIAMYGDHHGLNCGMEDVQNDVSAFIGRTYDYDEMMNVPLIIHVPGSGVDETIPSLEGRLIYAYHREHHRVDYDETFALGQDLTNATETVAFTSYLFEGSFVKDDVMFQISREGIFE